MWGCLHCLSRLLCRTPNALATQRVYLPVLFAGGAVTHDDTAAAVDTLCRTSSLQQSPAQWARTIQLPLS